MERMLKQCFFNFKHYPLNKVDFPTILLSFLQVQILTKKNAAVLASVVNFIQFM